MFRVKIKLLNPTTKEVGMTTAYFGRRGATNRMSSIGKHRQSVKRGTKRKYRSLSMDKSDVVGNASSKSKNEDLIMENEVVADSQSAGQIQIDMDIQTTISHEPDESRESTISRIDSYDSYEQQTNCVETIQYILATHRRTAEKMDVDIDCTSQGAQMHRHNKVKDMVRKIVNETPFVHMLSSMAPLQNNIQIPLISRKYEEKFMRECIGLHEKQCSMQEKCECMFIDNEQKFIGIRFPIPNINNEDISSNTMCILCLRKYTLLLYYKTMHAGLDPQVVIQKHGNICNEPGEYAQSAMIFANPNGPVHCMPLPVVAHQRNKYKVVTISGVKYLLQINMNVQNRHHMDPGNDSAQKNKKQNNSGQNFH